MWTSTKSTYVSERGHCILPLKNITSRGITCDDFAVSKLTATDRVSPDRRDLILHRDKTRPTLLWRPPIMNILPMKTRQKRFIILSFCGHVMLACTPSKATLPEPSSALVKDASGRAEKSDLIVPPKDCVVGQLIKNERFSARRPDGYCIEDNFYRGANFRLGRLNVFGLQRPPRKTLGRTRCCQLSSVRIYSNDSNEKTAVHRANP